MQLRSAVLALGWFGLSGAVFGGAWGVGAFENDSALDWAYKLERSSSLQILVETFAEVQMQGYLEMESCSHAIAAAEVVASMRTADFGHLPDGVNVWAEERSDEVTLQLVEKARTAVAVCHDDSRSEIAQLWSESESEEWRASLNRLIERLR